MSRMLSGCSGDLQQLETVDSEDFRYQHLFEFIKEFLDGLCQYDVLPCN